MAPVPLPIDSHLRAIIAATMSHGAAIVKAAPGAGKTTRLPPALLSSLTGRILVTGPRRMAARLSAERVAEELGEPVGGTIGYQIRQESRVSAKTRLVFVTEGLFLRLALSDPSLAGIDAVILDEFHERHLHTDLALALLRALRRKERPDLKLMVMSATLDTAALEAALPEAAVFDVPGLAYPVAVRYQPAAPQAKLEDQVLAAARELLADPECPGDILVFLTGAAEIQRLADHLLATLSAAAGGGVDILPLRADLTPDAVARVFAASGPRRIILATNVAETSITLPRVTGVIDCGRAKIPGHASWSGMPTLDVRKVAQASCIQRSGRAGRVAPGIAIRLFSEGDFLARPAFTPPEIVRLDLTETILAVAALRAATGQDPAPLASALPWLDAPPAAQCQHGEELLRHLGALKADDSLSELGRHMARLPLHPRLAAIALKAKDLGHNLVGAIAAAILAEGGLRTMAGRGGPVDGTAACDLRTQVHRLITSPSRDDRRLLTTADQIRALLGSPGNRQTRSNDLAKVSDLDWSRILLAGFPDRVAKLRPGMDTNDARSRSGRQDSRYHFCLGRGGVLAAGSVARGANLIIALDAAETQAAAADQSATIYLASPLSEEALLEAPGDLLGSGVVPRWLPEPARIDLFELETYGHLTLRESRLTYATAQPEHKAAVEALLAAQLADSWPKPFANADELTSYHARLDLLGADAAEFPRFVGDLLTLLQFEIAQGKRSFSDIGARSLSEYIEEQLTYEQRRLLHEATPLELELANGKRLRLRYEPGRPATGSGMIQDFYGLAATPRILGGKIPLTLELLGPRRRPVQVTSDLPGFWQRTYPALRQEYRRDYPRHHWPERPESAPPILHVRQLPK